MKHSLKFITISTFFIATLISPNQTSSIKCFDHPNSLNFHQRISVNCNFSTRSLKTKRKSSNDKFQINFTCGIDDKKLCDKVQKSFESAGQIIVATISLRNPITVDASFYDFCKTDNQCSNDNKIVAGGANPARTIALMDEEGVERHYPQALVKQLPFERHPDFGPFDILAKFNSEADYWFEGDESQIKPNQADFQLVVLHELIHGLGFYSSWNDFFDFVNPQGLTPIPSVEGELNENSGMIFNGFIENIFDKYLIFLSSGEYVSNITTVINTIVNEKGKFYETPKDFIIKFKSSPQYLQSQMMLKTATIPFSLGFLPKNANDSSEAIVLETTLNPFQTGSSLGHVDYKTYMNTSDFLMTYKQGSGLTLGDYMSIGGNYTGGPIGPKLRQVLKTMG
ncbi:10277_t:CDS:2 [Funneliformis caledonium]|uniref:10277_t:CDS:1 n=1 Tax=Funneliformis caledonium TaxID=1117310 RepID=A0A9N9F5J7_9GLOM|nr:10277_t:CDS:2 [Funneliformis caledonium]